MIDLSSMTDQALEFRQSEPRGSPYRRTYV